MKVIILAGGCGSRLQEESGMRPKPLIEIGGIPIIHHIMGIYSFYGINDFVVALGYRGDAFKDYFVAYDARKGDITIDLSVGVVTPLPTDHETNTTPLPWTVSLIDTGLNTMTGGRLKRLLGRIDGTFMMTYGDGLSDVSISDLLEFHKQSGKLCTLTAVRPPARFGGVLLDDNSNVLEFAEKRQYGDGWINGGFFVMEPGVLDYIDGDDTIFEHTPLENLANDRQLVAYRHTGFFKAMDTLRDRAVLEDLWHAGGAPWVRR